MRTLATLAAVIAAAGMNPAPALAGPLVATTDPTGSLTLKDGDRTVATFAPKTAVDQRGKTALRELTVLGHAVIEIRIPVLGEHAARQEVWLAERTAAGAKPIWWDVAGAEDSDGETTLVIAAGERGIETYQLAARLSRCDAVPVPLFRRVWDFASHRFRAQAPDLPAPGAVPVRARRGDAPAGKPLGGFFFTAASSSAGAEGQAARLKPPSAVNDGNPATVWSGADNGRGQLLTARSSGGFAVTGLRLLPGDTRSPRDYRDSAKPRRLALIFARDPGSNAEVELVEDADGGAKRFREPFWIALPKPVASGCVTVVVREATAEKAPLAIADLEVMTEIDGPEAADRLVASLAQGTSCAARQPLLVALGAPALAKVALAIPQAAPGAGRECLVDTLAALLAGGAVASPETADALVAATAGSSAGEEKTILKLLPTLPHPPVAALAAILHDDKRDQADRLRIARVLARVDTEEARAKLLSAVGLGPASLRKGVRDLAAGLKPPAAALALAAYQAAAPGGRRADLALVIGALAGREPGSAPAVLAALRASLQGSGGFEERARAIQALGLVHDPAAIEALAEVRAHDPDGVLRSLAVAELAGAQGARVLPALLAALDDGDPRVRETAAGALGRKGGKQATPALIAGAVQEPWPRVRRAEIAALGELCTTEGTELLVRAFQRDVEEVRQTALVGLARCAPKSAAQLLLRVLGRLPESAGMRSLAARLLAERKDSTTVHGMVLALGRLVTESQADLSLEGVVADTAIALAALGGAEAVSALVSLLSDSRPSLQRMAVEALGVVCDPGAGAAALRTAAGSKDESVSIPAATAEARCRDRR